MCALQLVSRLDTAVNTVDEPTEQEPAPPRRATNPKNGRAIDPNERATTRDLAGHRTLIFVAVHKFTRSSTLFLGVESLSAGVDVCIRFS